MSKTQETEVIEIVETIEDEKVGFLAKAKRFCVKHKKGLITTGAVLVLGAGAVVLYALSKGDCGDEDLVDEDVIDGDYVEVEA